MAETLLYLTKISIQLHKSQYELELETVMP